MMSDRTSFVTLMSIPVHLVSFYISVPHICSLPLCSQLIKLVEEPSVKSTLSNGDIATNGDTSAQSLDEDDTEWTVRLPYRWKFN